MPSCSIFLNSSWTIGFLACAKRYGGELDGRAGPVSIRMVARSVLPAAVPLAALYPSKAFWMSSLCIWLSVGSMCGLMSAVFSTLHDGKSGSAFYISPTPSRQTADGDSHIDIMLTWKVRCFFLAWRIATLYVVLDKTSSTAYGPVHFSSSRFVEEGSVISTKSPTVKVQSLAFLSYHVFILFFPFVSIVMAMSLASSNRSYVCLKNETTDSSHSAGSTHSCFRMSSKPLDCLPKMISNGLKPVDWCRTLLQANSTYGMALFHSFGICPHTS